MSKGCPEVSWQSRGVYWCPQLSRGVYRSSEVSTGVPTCSEVSRGVMRCLEDVSRYPEVFRGV